MKNWWTFTWRLGTVRGVEIRFHFSVLFSIVVAYFIFRPETLEGVLLALFWLLGFIVSVILHELAHALAAKRVSVHVKNIVIWLLGGLTNLDREPEKPFHRLLVSAAGPRDAFVERPVFHFVFFRTT